MDCHIKQWNQCFSGGEFMRWKFFIEKRFKWKRILKCARCLRDNQTITNLNLPLLLINSKEFGKRCVALFLGVSRLWSEGTLNNRIKSQNFLILSQFITTAPLLASALAEFCTLTQSNFELKSHRDGNKWHVLVPFANMSRLIYQFLKDFLKGKDSLHIRILFHLISLCYKLLIVWLSCLESWHCNEPRYKRTRTMQKLQNDWLVILI